MTAGQGPPGQEGWGPGPGQQSPYGQQPPWGQQQPPYGQQQPYGQQYGQPYGQQPPGQQYGQQYGGYGSAPQAPDAWGAPTPVARPQTVRLGIGAFLASVVLGLLSSIVTFVQFDEIVDQTLIDQGLDPADYSGATDVAQATAVTVGVVFGLIVIGLQLLFIYFAWQGRNWARIVLWVFGGLLVVSSLVSLAGPSFGGLITTLGWLQTLLALAGIVALALKPSNEWYRYRGWERARGR
ncbi:hypothetical protein ACI78R_01720 [Geodermatophilus sp. SYSU D01106]